MGSCVGSGRFASIAGPCIGQDEREELGPGGPGGSGGGPGGGGAVARSPVEGSCGGVENMEPAEVGNGGVWGFGEG